MAQGRYGDVERSHGSRSRKQYLAFVMPAVHIDGHVYYDGGLGQGAGIPLQLALDSGCSRIFAILTRPKGFRKPAPDIGRSARMIANSYHKYPMYAKRLLTRNERYNAELEKLEQLAAEGKAYIVYADKMAVENNTTDIKSYVRVILMDTIKHKRNFRWLEWLGIE